MSLLSLVHLLLKFHQVIHFLIALILVAACRALPAAVITMASPTKARRPCMNLMEAQLLVPPGNLLFFTMSTGVTSLAF